MSCLHPIISPSPENTRGPGSLRAQIVSELIEPVWDRRQTTAKPPGDVEAAMTCLCSGVSSAESVGRAAAQLFQGFEGGRIALFRRGGHALVHLGEGLAHRLPLLVCQFP